MAWPSELSAVAEPIVFSIGLAHKKPPSSLFTGETTFAVRDGSGHP